MEGPCCAHMRVVYRPEEARMYIPATEEFPGGERTVTRDSWKCSDCGTKFVPVAAASNPLGGD